MIGLSGKRILVTGSSQGIGRAIAEYLLRAGARVVTNSHEPLAADQAERFENLGESHFLRADLFEPSAPGRLVEQAWELLGGLDGLVNNAGTVVGGDFEACAPADFQRQMDLNVRAPFFAAQAFAKLAGTRDFDASIVSIGSTNSIQAEKQSVLYDTSKGAVLMLVRSLAVTLAEKGIRVNCVGPGLIKTALNHYAHEDQPELQRFLRKQIPAGRFGEPEDVAGAVAFLLSDDARYITGQMLCADGGIAALQMSYDV